MAKIETGLKDIIESSRVPAARYTWEIRSVSVTKSGWEMARSVVVEAEDEEVLGRTANLLLLNEDQGQSIGLQQLMTHKHWTELPEDENGERDTRTSLIGVRFIGDLFYEDGKSRLRPVIEEDDWGWQNSLLDGSLEEDEAPKPKQSKKKVSKKFGKR